MAQYKVTAQRLNVRREPNTSGLIVRTLNLHDLVEVSVEQDGWALTQSGWVSMKHLIPSSQPLTLADTALSIARSQLGVMEEPRGSNSGPKVSQYLASVGINFPASWCMAFVYWCVDKAAKELKQPNPLHKTGGVLAQWNMRKDLRVTTPRKGDIFIMDFGKGLGHTGFVENVQGDRIATIEGNASDANGGREGYIVTRKTRPLSSMKSYLRI